MSPSVEVSKSREFTYSQTSGWTDSQTTEQIDLGEQNYTFTVAPRTIKRVHLMIKKGRKTVGYTGNGFITFDITFGGFMRWSGNARPHHPTDRPRFEYTWAGGMRNMVAEYRNGNLPNSPWDWRWVVGNFPGEIDSVMSRLRRRVWAPVRGSVSATYGIDTYIKEEEERLP